MKVYNLIKNYYFIRKYINIIFYYFNVIRDFVVFYCQQIYRFVISVYNLIKNYFFIQKYVNIIVYYFNIFRKFVMVYCYKMVRFL